MEQALHIFRKDARHLWLAILNVIGLTIIFGARPPVSFIGYYSPLNILTLILPVAWWFLISAVIHQEALVGDRQFWITRPYSRKSLVLAKAIFLVAFIHVPLAVCDVYLLIRDGFPVLSNLGALLIRHLILDVLFVLPAAVVAVLTRNMPQFSVAAVGAMIAALLFRSPMPLINGDQMGWIRNLIVFVILLATGAFVVAWQYRTRRTPRGWTFALAGLLVGVVVYAVFPWSVSAAVETMLKPASPALANLQLAFDPSRPRPHPTDAPTQIVRTEFPMRVENLPQDVEMVVDGTEATLTTASGREHRFPPQGGSYVALESHAYRQGLRLEKRLFEEIKDETATIRIRTAITIFGKEAPLSIGPTLQPFAVKDAGICRVVGNRGPVPSIVCTSPFRIPPRLRVAYTYGERPPYSHWERTFETDSYSPFPSDGSLYPIHNRNFMILQDAWIPGGFEKPRQDSQITFTVEKPIAHLLRDVTISGVRLSDYRVPTGW